MVTESEMIHQAQKGDSEAFDRLTFPLRPLLFSYLNRRLAGREEAEDLCQEVLLKAFTQITECPTQNSFKVWLFRLAFLQSEEIIKNKDPWSFSSLDLLQKHLLENKGAEIFLQEIYQEYDEKFAVVDHINFCFTVMSRALYPKESNAIFLSELYNFTSKEISVITAASPETVDRLVKDGTETLGEALYDRCSLARPGAPCTQCQDFGKWLTGDDETEIQLKKLPFDKKEKARQSFFTRMEILAELDPLGKATRKFHGSLMTSMRKLMGEKGLDSAGAD